MAQKEKKTPEVKSEKTCNCGPECQCGCNEGKECTCGNGGCGGKCDCGCGCGCGGKCGCGCGGGCGKHCGKKLFVLLVVFLAGMGFNALLHGCCGRCPNRAPQNAPMMQAPKNSSAMPMFTDSAGTVIIINAADGHADIRHNPKHFDKHHKHKKEMQNPQTDKPEMRKPHFSGHVSSIRPLSAQPKAQNEDKDDDK